MPSHGIRSLYFLVLLGQYSAKHLSHGLICSSWQCTVKSWRVKRDSVHQQCPRLAHHMCTVTVTMRTYCRYSVPSHQNILTSCMDWCRDVDVTHHDIAEQLLCPHPAMGRQDSAHTSQHFKNQCTTDSGCCNFCFITHAAWTAVQSCHVPACSRNLCFQGRFGLPKPAAAGVDGYSSGPWA